MTAADYDVHASLPVIVRRCVVAAVAVATAIGLFLVASTALGTGVYRDCDNMAGECLRMRQQYTLDSIALVAGLAAVVCLWAAAWALVRRVSWWQAAAIVLAAGLLAASAVVNPVDHLDNRRHGWLSEPQP